MSHGGAKMSSLLPGAAGALARKKKNLKNRLQRFSNGAILLEEELLVSHKKLEKILEWTCKLLLAAATVISAIAQLISALK